MILALPEPNQDLMGWQTFSFLLFNNGVFNTFSLELALIFVYNRPIQDIFRYKIPALSKQAIN